MLRYNDIWHRWHAGFDHVDLGDRSSPYVSVHPRRKQELCRRLALQALKMQYGMTTLVASGPEFAVRIRWKAAALALAVSRRSSTMR